MAQHCLTWNDPRIVSSSLFDEARTKLRFGEREER
jgi:hypothetical protein